MTILVFAGSARKESLNRKLAQVAALVAGQNKEVTAEYLSLADFEMPLYNGDLEEAEGVPAAARELGRTVMESQALIIVSPEYNASIPSPLKNALDWVSRLDPSPFPGKPVLLLSASPGRLGASRALAHLRASLESMGCKVHPDSFSLPRADKAFAAEGGLSDPARAKKLEDLVATFVRKLHST